MDLHQSLYEISNEYQTLLDEIEEAEGILDDDTEKRLEILEQDYADKMRAYATKRKVIKGEIEIVNDEIKRFRNIIRSKENLSQRLGETMLDALDKFGEPTKSGGKRYKDELVNVFTVTRNKVVTDEIEPKDNIFNEYGITTLDFKLNYQQLQELYTFIDAKFGMDKIEKKGVKLQSKKVLDDYKKGILVKKTYFFNEQGLIANENDINVEEREVLINVETDDVYTKFNIEDNTFLSSR